jgi:hypothetical protein
MMEQKKSALIQQILKVIYAPHKAFNEIKENPKFVGPILIMILFIAANIGFAYALMSKTYVEQILPIPEQRDEWTENATLWTSASGANVRDNFVDFINGSYYGNRSIEFSTINSTYISMQIDNIGSVNCAGSDGYKNLSIRIKLTSPSVNPENVTMYLFSSTANYFCRNLTETLTSSTTSVWNNLTLPLGDEKWLKDTANADWGNITGLELEFFWHENSNITVLVDGLFFRGIFKNPLEFAGAMTVFNYASNGFTQFVIQWAALGTLIYVMVRAFGATITWKQILIMAGFALITLVVEMAINAVAFSTLPRLNYPLEFMGGVQGEGQMVFDKLIEATQLVSTIGTYLRLATYVWTVGLCALATRSLTGFSWPKSGLISAVAFFASITLVNILIGI